jgi:F-box/leucine-rich repeat protein 2/20
VFVSAAMAKEQERDGALIWMLADENLLAVLDKLPDRFDRQSWCMVCKKFLYLEAVSRNYVHLMRPEILEPVLKRYRQVEHLDLSSCVEVKDSCLATVAKYTSERLLSIKLMRTKGFGGVGVRSLVECKSLQEVDLSMCTQVGDADVIALSELKHLQKLKLTQCRNVTDVGLLALSRCKELRTLGLKFCSGLGDDGIQAVATGCPQLRNIELSFTEVIWPLRYVFRKGGDHS